MDIKTFEENEKIFLEQIKDKCIENNSFMLSPNGERTNLSTEDWLFLQAHPELFENWKYLAAYKYATEGNSVQNLSGTEFQKVPYESIVDRVLTYYTDIYSNRVSRLGIGEVVLDKKGIKDSLAHGLSKEKAAAFAAVPKIIEKGILYNKELNWKNRNYDTAVLIAPIVIGGVPYAEEVVLIRQPSKNRFYLHEVEIKKELQEMFKTLTEESKSRSSYLILTQHFDKIKSCNIELDKNYEPTKEEIEKARELYRKKCLNNEITQDLNIPFAEYNSSSKSNILHEDTSENKDGVHIEKHSEIDWSLEIENWNKSKESTNALWREIGHIVEIDSNNLSQVLSVVKGCSIDMPEIDNVEAKALLSMINFDKDSFEFMLDIDNGNFVEVDKKNSGIIDVMPPEEGLRYLQNELNYILKDNMEQMPESLRKQAAILANLNNMYEDIKIDTSKYYSYRNNKIKELLTADFGNNLDSVHDVYNSKNKYYESSIISEELREYIGLSDNKILGEDGYKHSPLYKLSKVYEIDDNGKIDWIKTSLNDISVEITVDIDENENTKEYINTKWFSELSDYDSIKKVISDTFDIFTAEILQQEIPTTEKQLLDYLENSNDVKFEICDKDDFTIDNNGFQIALFSTTGYILERLLDPDFDLDNDTIKFYYTENQKGEHYVLWQNHVQTAHPLNQSHGLISNSNLPDELKSTIIKLCQEKAEEFCKEKFGCDIEQALYKEDLLSDKYLSINSENLASSIWSKLDDLYSGDAEHEERYYCDFDSGLLSLPDFIENEKVKDYRLGIVFNSNNKVVDYFIDAIMENDNVEYDVQSLLDEKHKSIFNAAENKIAFNILKNKYHIAYEEGLKSSRKAAEEHLGYKSEELNSVLDISKRDEILNVADNIFHETAKTDEVVGYYLEYYPDNYLSQWKDNMKNKELSEQDKNVSIILQNLYSKEHPEVVENKKYEKVKSINDLCTDKTFLAYPQLSLTLQEDIIANFEYYNLPLYKDKEGNIYQREVSKGLSEDNEEDFHLLTQDGIIDQEYWWICDAIANNGEAQELVLLKNELEEIRLFEKEPKTYFKNVFNKAIQKEITNIKKELEEDKLNPLEENELQILAEERLGSYASAEEIVGWYITDHEDNYLENFKKSGDFAAYSEQVLRLMEKTKQIENEKNNIQYKPLDIGKYFNSHLPENVSELNNNEIKNLKLYTQELSDDILLYDKKNDKAYRIWNGDSKDWNETHDKKYLHPVDVAELLDFAEIEANGYVASADEITQQEEIQEAKLWSKRFHENLIYIQARSFADLSTCYCEKVEDFVPDNDDSSKPFVNVSEYRIILNNENANILGLKEPGKYIYDLTVKFGKDTKITDYRIDQMDAVSGEVLKEGLEKNLNGNQKEIWEMSKSYIENFLHYSIDKDFDITCDYAFPEEYNYLKDNDEISVTIYEEPRWSFKNDKDILQIIKDADVDFYNKLQTIIKEHPDEKFAFDLGKELVYRENYNTDENDLSKQSLKEKLDNEFIVRYWNIDPDNTHEEINNFDEYGEHIYIEDPAIADKLNKMIENHVNNNIKRYKEFKDYRQEKLTKLLKKELLEHGEPSLTVDGNGKATKRFQTHPISPELQSLLGIGKSFYDGEYEMQYALFADYELNSEGGLGNKPQIKLWSFYDTGKKEIHTRNSGNPLENNYSVTPACLKLVEDTFDEIACENTQETYYSRDYWKMAQVFEGMNLKFTDKSKVPIKDTFAYNFNYICKEFKQKEIPENSKEHRDVLFTTVTHLIMDNFNFGKLDYYNFDECYGLEGVDYRWDICDKATDALFTGKLTAAEHIQDFIYKEGENLMNELKNRDDIKSTISVGERIEDGFNLILKKYKNNEYGKEIANDIKDYKYSERENLVNNVFSMLEEHYKNGEKLITLETSKDDTQTIEIEYTPSDLEILIKARDAFMYGEKSLSFIRPNAQQIEDGISEGWSFDTITTGYGLGSYLDGFVLNGKRLSNITNIESIDDMMVFESNDDAAMQYEKDNEHGILKEKRDMWIGDRDVPLYSIPNTPENRAALKEYLIDKPLVEKFDWSGFTEETFNKFKEELISGKENHDFKGAVTIGSVSIEISHLEADGWIDTAYFILGEDNGYCDKDVEIPYSHYYGEQFAYQMITDNSYEEFKEKFTKWVIGSIDNVEQTHDVFKNNTAHIRKEMSRPNVGWNNKEMANSLYKTKLGEQLLEVISRNSLSMSENDKNEATELLLKGADPKEALLFVAADANILENCHWLVNHIPYGNTELFQDKVFANKIYEIAKESVTLDEEMWEDVSDIGYHGFEEIAKLCGRLEEAEEYYKQLKEKHPELSDYREESWNALEKQFTDAGIVAVRGDFSSIKKEVIESMQSKDMYDSQSQQEEVVCRILADELDFGSLNESSEEEGLDNHSVHSERSAARWSIVENLAEKIVRGELKVKDYQTEANKLIEGIIGENNNKKLTELENKKNIQGEITMNENESVEQIEEKLDKELLKLLNKLDGLRIDSDKENKYARLSVLIPDSELKNLELFSDRARMNPGEGLKMFICNDYLHSTEARFHIDLFEYQNPSYGGTDIGVRTENLKGHISIGESPLPVNDPSVYRSFDIYVPGSDEKKQLNNKFFLYANKDIILEKTIEACKQRQEELHQKKEKELEEKQKYENNVNDIAGSLGLTENHSTAKEKKLSFTDDIDKMRDFDALSKEEFLKSYSYLTEEEYAATAHELSEKGITGKEQARNIEKSFETDLKDLVEGLFDDAAFDPIIDEVRIYHPEDYGFEKDDNLHLLVQFHNNEELVGTTFREDDMFNSLQESGATFLGQKIDFNPIDVDKSGTIDRYLKNLKESNVITAEKNNDIYVLGNNFNLGIKNINAGMFTKYDENIIFKFELEPEKSSILTLGNVFDDIKSSKHVELYVNYLPYEHDWDEPADIAVSDDNGVHLKHLINSSFGDSVLNLSDEIKEKIIELSKTAVNEFMEIKCPGRNIREAFYTSPYPVAVFGKGEELASFINNENKSDVKEPSVSAEDGKAILDYFEYGEYKIYKAGNGKAYIIDMSEDFNGEGQLASNSDIIENAMDCAESAKDYDASCYNEISYKQLKKIFDEYDYYKEHNRDPLELIEEVAKNSEQESVPELFLTEFHNGMISRSLPKSPFEVAGSIVKNWKETKPDLVPVLNEWLKKQGCTSKEGFENFFNNIEEIKTKENEQKTFRNRRTKSDESGRGF